MSVKLASGQTVHTIGDPHIAKKFEAGVAPEKRGLREAHVLTQFEVQLNPHGADYVICMGDVFDHPYVSAKAVVDTAQLILNAGNAHPKTVFCILAGNHDLSRNISVVGAFDLLDKILADRLPNVTLVREPTIVGEIALFPWQWGVSALEQLEGLDLTGVQSCYGHWDLQSYGGDDSHMCPAAELAALGITEIHSGHYHIAGTYAVNGVDVNCTGSMEPYSHGEDPEGKIYVTLSLDEATDGRDLTAKCVRVVLKDGEELPEGLDCMALTAIKEKLVADEGNQVSLGKFEWQTVLEEALADLDPDVKQFIEERLSA